MPLNWNKTLDYRYEFRNGALVKTDFEGNVLSWGTMAPEMFTRHDASEEGLSTALPQKNRVATDRDNMIGESQPTWTDDELPIPSPDETLTSLPEFLKPKITGEELAERDRDAVEYHNSLLTTGDTLVFVRYTQDNSYFNSSGLEVLSRPHRVHSGRLLSTGSEKFKKLLEDSTYQFRVRRRLQLVNRLPQDIKYVLDLTPPEEGEEAVELTANLSCSYGIRRWHTSSDRIGVADNLVSGEDDIDLAKNIVQYGVPNPANLEERGCNDAMKETELPVSQDPVIANANWKDEVSGNAEDRQIDEAISMSVREANKKNRHGFKPKRDKDDVPEYCSFRHRAGIVRLLQVIEGKNPRLDSAPKVWTLFTLAHYFDCTSVVVDWIIQWTLADPNSQIIEILPEVCLKMAFGMKNMFLCRASFAFLVSEEALSLTSRSLNKHWADQAKTNQFSRYREEIDEDTKTRIEYASKAYNHRIQETFSNLVDANWFTAMPEYRKLQQFLDAIALFDSSGSVSKSSQKTTWWLSAITNLIVAMRHYVRGRIVWAANARIPNKTVTQSEITKLDEHRLAQQYKPNQGAGRFQDTYNALDHREHVMTPFFWRTLRGLEFYPYTNSGNLLLETRNQGSQIAELYGIKTSHTSTIENHASHVNKAIIEAINMGIYHKDHVPGSEYPCSVRDPTSTADELEMRVHFKVLDHKLRHVLGDSEAQLGIPVRLKEGDSSGLSPGTNLDGRSLTKLSTVHLSQDDWYSVPHDSEFVALDTKSWTTIEHKEEAQAFPTEHSNQSFPAASLPLRAKETIPAQHPNFNAWSDPQQLDNNVWASLASGYAVPPRNSDIDENSPFFNLSEFFLNVRDHIQSLCNEMVNTSFMGFDVAVTDTLLCLNDEEFKYLPLWAGGDDDDSGGVFDEMIPSALAGPNGPGPSFHTGYSNASAASSEFGGFDGRSDITSFNTSVGVEDGFSDHLDRRRVLSDDDFHSEIFSEDSEVYTISDNPDSFDRKGKGKAIAHAFDGHTISSTTSEADTQADMSILNDGISTASTEMGFTTDDDFEDDDCEDDANTTVGEADDEDDDMWDDKDGEEAFDFGDSDEEMSHV